MIVLYNTNYTHNPNAYLTLAIERSLRALVGDAEVVRCDNRTLLPVAATGEHDMLICIDGQRLKSGLIRRARGAFSRTVLWAFEDPFMLDYNLRHLDLFDLVFTNDPSCVEFYRGKGRYLPLGANHALHSRKVLPDSELRHDIFFAGTMWPNRVPVIGSLIAAFPEARIKLVCPTNEYLPPLPPEIADRAITRPISHEAFVDFANQSRVVVTLFRDYASHGDASRATAPGPRLFELGYAGTAQVVECGDMPREHFARTDGIALVDDTAALVAEVGRLLADPALRRERAETAQASIETHHTYEQRLIELLAASAKAPARPDGATAPASRSRKLRVLMCTHSTMHNHVWGGVEVYQDTLATVLSDDVETFFWVRRNQSCQLLDRGGRVLEHFDAPDIGWLDVLSDMREESHFSDVLAGYDIDVVHIQHLGHHAASLPIIAKAAGAGVVFSVHDFFLVCSRYNLLDYELKFCNIGERSITACNVCLRVAEGLPSGVQQQRRLFLEQVLESVDTLLFGSAHSEQLLLNIYPTIAGKRRLVLGIPMPISAMPQQRVVPRDEFAGARKLVVAIVGNFIRTKGADTILNVIETANPNLFEFHIHGEIDGHYRAAIDAKARRNVVCHGRYKPGDLALGGAEAALHLSLWPETYCISLSEVWRAGLIPIVTDVGALADRVEHGVNGFKVAIGDASGVVDLLEMIRVGPELRRTLRARIDNHLWVEAPEYGRALLAEYRAIAPKAKLDEAKLSLDIGQLHLLPKQGWKDLSPPRHIFDAPRRPGAVTLLPQTIREWISIQGSEFYLDKVCGHEKAPEMRDGDERRFSSQFTPLDEFSIQGWTFVPDASVAGQIYVCLIHRVAKHVVFVEAERATRDDVLSIFPNAPIRSGFLAQARLSGKWADGDYLIGVVNVMGEKAAFQLSARTVRFYEGRVTGLGAIGLDNDTILAAFTNVFAKSQTAETRPEEEAGALEVGRAAPPGPDAAPAGDATRAAAASDTGSDTAPDTEPTGPHPASIGDAPESEFEDSSKAEAAPRSGGRGERRRARA